LNADWADTTAADEGTCGGETLVPVQAKSVGEVKAFQATMAIITASKIRFINSIPE
jgi:hypothetical protein